MSAAAPSRPDFLESEPFVVELERFQGPLDLLLHLIRSQDIDIFDIPIARITQQFQTALEAGLERLELDRAGEFVEMASTLIRIKAQLLLPRPGEPDWDDDPRSELVRRLLEYEHFHEVAQLLSSREAERARHFGKGFVEPRPTPEARHTELETGRDELLEAARQVPEPPEEIVHEAPVRRVTVEQKISLLGRLVRSVKRLAFEKLFQPWGTRSHAVASFLACLEMARRQVVRLEQVERFGSIWIFPGPGGEATGDEGPRESPGTSAGGEPAGDGTPEERAPDAPVNRAGGSQERDAAP